MVSNVPVFSFDFLPALSSGRVSSNFSGFHTLQNSQVIFVITDFLKQRYGPLLLPAFGLWKIWLSWHLIQTQHLDLVSKTALGQNIIWAAVWASWAFQVLLALQAFRALGVLSFPIFLTFSTCISKCLHVLFSIFLCVFFSSLLSLQIHFYWPS